jgi:uncharacterized protein (TIGR02453 family)
MNFKALDQFLRDLSQNNHRAWFEANKPRYQEIRAEFITFVNELIGEAVLVDPQLAGLEAKNSIFRINRDVRFSANKAPYKTNFSAYLSKGGKKFPGAGYYFHFEPGASFMAAGIWMPEAPLLKAIRQEIDYGWSEFEKLANHLLGEGYELGQDALSRPPKGYESENPAIEYLKLKSFVFTQAFNLVDNHLLPQFIRQVNQLKPFVYFLNQALEVSDNGFD